MNNRKQIKLKRLLVTVFMVLGLMILPEISKATCSGIVLPGGLGDMGSITCELANTAPRLIITGDNPLNIFVGDIFVDPGANAYDEEDGDLTSQIVTNVFVDTSTPGTYEVRYSVTDSGGLSDSSVRIVVVTTKELPLPENDKLNLVAKKIVCDSESDLPNWGVGGPNISESVINQFLNTHPNCHLQSGWFFQWMDSTASDPGATFVGEAPSWNTFGPTDSLGVASTSVIFYPETSHLWVREVLKDGYLAFTYPGTNDANSAEMYCHKDVLNYDNYDMVEGPLVNNEFYYCVAFNVLITPPTNTPPVITLSGNNPLNLVVGNAFVEPGYTATDTEDGDLTASTTISGTVDTAVAGTYTLIYSVTDSGGLSASTTRSVVISSTTLPIIPTLSLSANPNSIIIGATSTLTWNALNASSCLAVWTTSTSTVGSEIVSPATTTDYVMVCSGSYGDISATTTIVVSATTTPTNTSPTINLLGNNPLNLSVGATFVEPGYTATDTEDGDLTASTTISGTVDTAVAGTYTLIYSVTDSGGLSASTTRSVVVSSGSNGGGGGGGGGGSLSGGRRHPIVVGEILGATSCMYLRDYLKVDWQNDPIEVLKLQAFLNSFEGEKLSLNGKFDQATFDAVVRFQTKYSGDILMPWGDNIPTGFVYILTKKKVNEIYCSSVFPISQADQEEINNYKTSFVSGSVNTLNSIYDILNSKTGDDQSILVELEAGKENSKLASTSVAVKNAAVSMFGLSKKVFSSGKNLTITLILLIIAAAVISLFITPKSAQIAKLTGNNQIKPKEDFEEIKTEIKNEEILINNEQNAEPNEEQNEAQDSLDIFPDEEIVIENPEEGAEEISEEIKKA